MSATLGFAGEDSQILMRRSCAWNGVDQTRKVFGALGAGENAPGQVGSAGVYPHLGIEQKPKSIMSQTTCWLPHIIVQPRWN